MAWIQMADPGGGGHGSAGWGVLHLASGVRVPEKALPNHQPQRLPGANSHWGPQTSTRRWRRGKREEGRTPGEKNVCGSYAHLVLGGVWMWTHWKSVLMANRVSSGLQGEAWRGYWVLPQPLPSCFLSPCCWGGRGDDDKEGRWAWQRYVHRSHHDLIFIVTTNSFTTLP